MGTVKRLPSSESNALILACDAFSQSTQRYLATPVSSHSGKSDTVDAWVHFSAAGKHFEMPVLIKTATTSHAASAVLARMHTSPANTGGRPLMLVTQHVSQKLAEDLIRHRIPFMDTAGNVYLDEPEATIMIVGRGNPAVSRTDNTSRSTTPKGLRVSFALLTHPGLVHAPYRTIAERSAVALNTVNVAMDDLMSRGLVVQKGIRRIIPERRRFIEDWVSVYPTRLRPKLSPRRFSSWASDKTGWWRTPEALDSDARFGGEIGAELLTGKIKPATVTVYSHSGITPRLMAAGLLRPDDRGEVEVLEAFWPVEAEAGWNRNHPHIAHPLLIYADLIASPDDRNRDMAKSIYREFLENESA